MDNRLKEWFETYGRRLVELKIAGGEEFFVSGEKDLSKLNNLTGSEWIEFFNLIGQLDGLVWILQPDDQFKAKGFQKMVAAQMDKLEKRCRHIFEITGRLSIPKGYA